MTLGRGCAPAPSPARSPLDDLTEQASPHFINSTLRERIVEHVFVGEALRRLWQMGVTDV